EKNQPPPSDAGSADVTDIDLAIARLEELRRLFFSIVEHLRDTAQRQVELNDQTAQVLGNETNDNLDAQVGPLGNRQQSLREIADAIAEALKEQSQAANTSTANQAVDTVDSQQVNQQEAEARKLAAAAEKVNQGSEAMQAAADLLSAPQLPEVSAVSSQQTEALTRLAEALQILDESQSSEQPNTDESKGDQQQEQQQNQGSSEEPQQQQDMNASQMLQAIRDRESQRRHEKNKHAATDSRSVEKDW
ncbi:MAG: hypothetical protein KDB22_29980, partial [Planctomycetales bacterium]|nr:hypothetical protein [Planctomycetales bacterium]